jgi:hypothetical protein
MKRSLQLSLIACLLGLGLVGPACSSKSSHSSRDRDERSKDDDDSKDRKRKHEKDDDDEDDRSAKNHKHHKSKDEVDIDDLLKDDSGEEKSGMLKVTLPPDDGKDVPVIGGGDEPPIEIAGNDAKDESDSAAPKIHVDWFTMGDTSVPNPGWARSDKGPVAILTAPDGKVAFIFVPFTTEDEANLISSKFMEGAQALDMKWTAAPKQVRIGRDHLPANVGSGHGLFGDAKTPMKLVYAEIKTSKSKNLLVIGLEELTAPAAEVDLGKNIVTSIKLAQ